MPFRAAGTRACKAGFRLRCRPVLTAIRMALNGLLKQDICMTARVLSIGWKRIFAYGSGRNEAIFFSEAWRYARRR